MSRSFIDSLSGFGFELLEGIREQHYIRLDDTAFEERVIGMKNATMALCEVKIEDDKIIHLLQKYWDLRRSEASELLNQVKSDE